MAEKSILSRARPVSRIDNLKGETHPKNFVWWLDVVDKHIEDFDRCLRKARLEQDIQSFLERNPMVLIQHLGGGHGRWVIPKKRLGSEYVTDFIIGQKDSSGYEWQAVELERPDVKMFTKAGNPTAQLTHAIRQIQNWRRWLTKNQNYAAREVSDEGLGLRDITAALSGMILIGRREEAENNLGLRRQMMTDLNIELHSYDFLADNARIHAGVYHRIKMKYNEEYRKEVLKSRKKRDKGTI